MAQSAATVHAVLHLFVVALHENELHGVVETLQSPFELHPSESDSTPLAHLLAVEQVVEPPGK